MSTSILKFAPAGVLGDVTRLQESNVEAVMQGSQFPAFGQPAKYDGAGKIVPFAGGEVASDFVGIITRMVPSISGNLNQGFQDTIPWLSAAQGLLVRGYCVVACTVGVPVRGGKVYARIVAALGKSIGDLEAVADGVNSIELPNMEFAINGKDASNLAEIRFRA
jgi:hypothetical protein